MVSVVMRQYLITSRYKFFYSINLLNKHKCNSLEKKTLFVLLLLLLLLVNQAQTTLHFGWGVEIDRSPHLLSSGFLHPVFQIRFSLTS